MKIQSPQDLGAYVRVERKKRRWTQAELASRAGVKPLWISQFERGKPSAQIGLVMRTLKALGLVISVDDSTRSAGGATGVDLDTLVQPLPEEVAVEPGETTDEATRRAMTDEEEKGAGHE